MKRFLILFIGLFISGFAYSQQPANEDFRQKQKESMAQFRQTKKEEIRQYRDSINAEFAKYMAETWKSFNLVRQERSFKPLPKPPVYVPDTPQPAPPAPKPQPSEEKPQPVTPQPKPDIPQYPVKTNFFGTPIALKAFSQSVKPLSGVSEKEVAAYWNVLSQLPYAAWTDEIGRIKADLNLNDWGIYLLINQLFKTYFSTGTSNEQVIFTVFMLNQLNYRAKIGRNQNELLPLIAFQNQVYNTPFFLYGNEGKIRYAVVNPLRKNLSAIQSCTADYPGATKNLNLQLETLPHWAISLRTQTLSDRLHSYELKYNQNLVDYYATYPDMEFSLYVEAPLDPITLQSIQTQISPDIRNKSPEEAVNLLLHFVQRAFEYKTDNQQFGYEKWNFAEETIASSYSDCEDRAILFAQLVRHLLDMPVVLIHYPGIHLATAVKFDNPQTNGDYVMVDGTKYLICDPTYIGADLGRAMPDLKTTAIEIIKLKKTD